MYFLIARPLLKALEIMAINHLKGLARQIEIESFQPLRHIYSVKATTKRHTKSEAELLDHATNNLLRAVKQKIVKKQGRVDYDKLRKEGYSDRFLSKVQAA